MVQGCEAGFCLVRLSIMPRFVYETTRQAGPGEHDQSTT